MKKFKPTKLSSPVFEAGQRVPGEIDDTYSVHATLKARKCILCILQRRASNIWRKRRP